MMTTGSFVRDTTDKKVGNPAVKPAAGTGNITDKAWVSVAAPEVLHIRNGQTISYGAHQLWYTSWMGKMGGCGPTAASNLLWYLAETRPDSCRSLFRGNGNTRTGMHQLMNQVWQFIRPGMRGVDKASMLTDGAVNYGEKYGVLLRPRVLEIPAEPVARLSRDAMYQFLMAAFSDNLPVAFLNLSNGTVRNLDNWHWVTLVGTDGREWAEMYDQSRRQNINLSQWLDTTKNGGAFVVLEPAFAPGVN